MAEKSVIVDAGPLVAFLVETDQYHHWAVDVFGELNPPFLTCEPVLTETFHLVARLQGGRQRFFQTGKPPVEIEETLEICAFIDAAWKSSREKCGDVELGLS